MRQTKVQIKLQRDNGFAWGHFCYVPNDLKSEFDKYVNTSGWLNNHWISLWAYNDFRMVDVDTIKGLARLKEAIKNKYREVYPDLYLETNTDRQGWLRLWYVENMRLELNNVGR